jgi:hypothetical protein
MAGLLASVAVGDVTPEEGNVVASLIEKHAAFDDAMPFWVRWWTIMTGTAEDHRSSSCLDWSCCRFWHKASPTPPSAFFPKFSGTIYEILSAPVSFIEIITGYVGAAASKSVLLGLIILATARLIVNKHIATIEEPWQMSRTFSLTRKISRKKHRAPLRRLPGIERSW